MPTTSTCANLVAVPGPPGAAGVAGSNGTNGINAVSFVNGNATPVPAWGASVTLPLKATNGSQWMGLNQIVYIAPYGYYQVTALPDATHATVLNLGNATAYPGNIDGFGNFSDNSKVSPGGLQGPSGSAVAGAMLTTDNLAGLASNAASRTNLGLGTAATSNVTDFFSVANNLSEGVAATMRTNLGLSIGTNVQAFNAFLAGFVAAGPGVADRLPYLTAANTFALATLTAAMRTLLASASNSALLSTLKLLPRYGVLGSLASIDLNVATSDNAITINSTRYRIDKLVVEGASINLTAATLGLFTAAGGAGTTLAADQALSALTASSKYDDLTLQTILTTDLQTAGTLYARVGTPQGAAATARVWIIGWDFS